MVGKVVVPDMSKKKYENFTLGLALFDALPVLFFCVATLLIAVRFRNGFFLAGAILCTLSGISKVIWKILLAGIKKDFQIANKQMRFFMPLGFVLMIIGLVTGCRAEQLAALKTLVFSFPAVLCFGITIAGMCLMMVFAFKLDATKARSNWIEQITNALAQGCFLLGVLLCM